MAKGDGQYMAVQLAEFVNVSTHDKIEFAETVTSDHRYLQQEMFNAMMRCIEYWAEAYDNGRYDPRNEHAVKASKAMIDGLKAKDLY
jgi:hypothetical protein